MTIRSTSKHTKRTASVVGFTLCLSARSVWAQDTTFAADPSHREAFAQSLMDERDYFRAITVWKELRFETHDAPKRMHYALKIAGAYRRSNKFVSALGMLPHVLNLEAATPIQRSEMALIGAESYLGLKLPYQAETLLSESLKLAPAGSSLQWRSELLLGVARADSNDLDAAAHHFHKVAQAASPYTDLARSLEARTALAKDRPSRSPAAAAILSAVLPGAGQAYTGHWVDAAQAFALVGAFGFASFLAYSYESERDRPYALTAISLSLTGILHVANIMGAERTARYFNQRQRDLHVDGLRTMALAFP